MDCTGHRFRCDGRAYDRVDVKPSAAASRARHREPVSLNLGPNDPRSPVWGGGTIALIIGVIFGGLSVLLGWGSFLGNGLKGMAVVFTFLTAISIPGDIYNIVRRTPLASRAPSELFWGIVVSAVLLYLAFVVVL